MFGWKVEEVVVCCDPRLEAEVLTDRFFMLRIFLFGESPRLSPGRLAKAVEGRLAWSIPCIPDCFAVPNVGANLERGAADCGDSGDELGEGSVSEESMVEMVVVGEESVDSNVDAESLLNICEEQWLLGNGRLLMFATLFGAVAPSSSVASCVSAPFPNTGMNDGNEASSDPEPVVAGILDSRSPFGEPFAHEDDCCTDGEAIAKEEVSLARQSLV